MIFKKIFCFIIILSVFCGCTTGNKIETEILDNNKLLEPDSRNIDSTSESTSLGTEIQNPDGTVSIIADENMYSEPILGRGDVEIDPTSESTSLGTEIQNPDGTVSIIVN